MVVIRFADSQTEQCALGYLAGRLAGKTWANGDTLVSEEALAHLAAKGIEFTIKGRPTYEREYVPLRDSSPATV